MYSHNFPFSLIYRKVIAVTLYWLIRYVCLLCRSCAVDEGACTVKINQPWLRGDSSSEEGLNGLFICRPIGKVGLVQVARGHSSTTSVGDLTRHAFVAMITLSDAIATK